jgi:hypothetical protein
MKYKEYNMNELDESKKTLLIIWALLGLVGGIVRVCDNSKHVSIRQIISSLLTSTFAGMITGSLIHNYVSDPMTLGGVCAMAGYLGQVGLLLLVKWGRKKLNLD